ncbi:MAG TPA: fibronectin type III domain-containing protein, partial [Armatimonadota bacterium]|nr:fibronectin type III domain-containing protein [Armatimonadota bacterium]
MTPTTPKLGGQRTWWRRPELLLVLIGLASVAIAGGSMAGNGPKRDRLEPLGGSGRADLSNGTGDAHVSVSTDPYGRFRSLQYDPLGELPASETTFDSKIWYSGAGGAGTGGNGTYLTANALPPLEFTAVTPSRAVSTFAIDGVQFQLVQEVLPAGSTGSVFRQAYTVTNNTGAPTAFDLIRYFDGDLDFDGSLEDRAGVSANGQLLFEFDSADNPDAPTTFVGIDFNNMSNLGFRLDDFNTDPDGRIEQQGRAYLNNQITRGEVNADTNGDRITDEPYDVTLSLGRTFELANGATAVLVTNTILGEGTPEEVLVAPTNLEATAVSGTAIDLTFIDNSPDETGFSVERRTEPDGEFAPLVTLPANVRSYRDTTVLPGVTYTYRVRALFGTRGSAFSNEASATTPGGGAEGIRLAGPATVSISDGQACYQASLTRGGAPAANVPILFELTGTTGNNTTNPVAVTTNSAGVAEFCFVPTTPGADDLVACADLNGNAA